MELLIAFLITFGFINGQEEAKKLSEQDVKEVMYKQELEKDYIIWEAEADDF